MAAVVDASLSGVCGLWSVVCGGLWEWWDLRALDSMALGLASGLLCARHLGSWVSEVRVLLGSMSLCRASGLLCARHLGSWASRVLVSLDSVASRLLRVQRLGSWVSGVLIVLDSMALVLASGLLCVRHLGSWAKLACCWSLKELPAWEEGL